MAKFSLLGVLLIVQIFYLPVTSANVEGMKQKLSHWGIKKKLIFHYNLIRAMEEMERAITAKELDKSQVNTKNLLRILEKILPPTAVAGESRPPECIWGGWPSYYNSSRRKCLPAYNSRVRARVSKAMKYTSCGKRGVVRCNPVLFSADDCPPEGCCTKIEGPESNSPNVIRSCLLRVYGTSPGPNQFSAVLENKDTSTFSGSKRYKKNRQQRIIKYLRNAGGIDIEKLLNHLNTLSNDSPLLAEYVALSAHVLQHCHAKKGLCGDSYCEKIRRNIDDTSFDFISTRPCKKGGISLNTVKERFTEILYWLRDKEDVSKEIRQAENKKALLSSPYFRDFSDGFWTNHACLPHDQLKHNQKKMSSLGRGSCLADKKDMQEVMLEASSWKGLGLEERAYKIYQVAKATYREMKKAAGRKWNIIHKVKKNHVSPHEFFPFVNPSLVSCIAFHETRGSLNPFAYNYTYCSHVPISSAHGLGQITRSTLKDAMNERRMGSVIPSQGMTRRGRIVRELQMDYAQAHAASSLSPEYQLELSLRILNHKAKLLPKRRRDLFGRVIEAYDNDGKKIYVPTVKACYKCMNGLSKNPRANDIFKCANILKR